jgi:5-methylthioadenosine/S-adenosylhomocysteine deaminase
MGLNTSSIFIKNGFLLTMTGKGLGTIEDGAVAIQGQDIVAVGKTRTLIKEYSSSDYIIDAKGKAVLPGFIDGHIHTGLSLLRGEAQDVPEIEWMLKTLGPLRRYIKPEHSIKGVALGVLEAVKSGTTTFGEIGDNMSPAADKVFLPSGVRANLANTINEIGPDSRTDPMKPYIFYEDVGEKKFKDATNLIDRYDGKGDGRISVILSPQGADMMSENLLLRVKKEAKKRVKMLHIHVAQGGREQVQMNLRYNMSTIKFLDSINYLDESVIAAHCHQTTDDEVTLLAQRGTRYASCPSSISIIDGITPPLALFLQSGGRYATIGTDQACGNNCHNMLMEMKIAALLNKTRQRDPTVIPAWQILRLVTIDGAITLGLGDKIGSLEPGKKADVILIDLKAPHMTPIIMKPVRNVAPNIVYSARGDEVTHVIVNGQFIVLDQKVLTMNEEKVINEAQKAGEEIAEAGSEDFFKAGSVLAKAVEKGLL